MLCCAVLYCLSCRVHFVFVVLFTAYGMWLLDQHYKVRVPVQWVTQRQALTVASRHSTDTLTTYCRATAASTRAASMCFHTVVLVCHLS